MLELTLYGLFALVIIIWAVIVWRLSYAISHFRFKQFMSATSMIDDLPSVSVCIPARNETHAMTECLEKVIASTYPKLEIIVLDDMSGDDTSALIKAFAHEGVRFVEGKKLPVGWLGKNHALQGLTDEASGSYIFFMDVDTRIEPDTIEQMVAYAQQEKATMISVLPRRHDGWRMSVLFSTLRYFWEIIFHRKKAPATASNAWMIRREALLNEFGGIEPFKMAIQPETQLSARLMQKNEYRFLIGTKELGISYEKKWRSQVSTSIRLVFPLMGGRIYLGLLAMIGFLLLLMPLCVVAEAYWLGWTYLQTISLGIMIAYSVTYAVYLSHVWDRGWWVGALIWPIVVLQEFGIFIVSIERYLRGDVTWKGRPVSEDTSKAGRVDA